MTHTQRGRRSPAVWHSIVTSLALFIFLFAAGPARAECFELWNSVGKLIYQDNVPPFDISYPDVSPKSMASKGRGELLIITVEQCGRLVGSYRNSL